MIDVQGRVGVVPAEDLQGRQIAHRFILGKVGEGDLPLVAFAVVGDEKQVVQMPGGLIGFVGRSSLLDHQLAEDAAQGHDRQALRFKLDEEDAPGLVGDQGPELLDLFDLGGSLGIDAQFLRLIVESQVFKVFGLDGPVQFVPQILDQRREGFYFPKIIG